MFEDYDEEDPQEKKPKSNRQKQGRLYEVMKKLRLQSHEHGEFCYCKRLDCMNKVNEEDRKTDLKNFNAFESHNEQNSYLCGLMSINVIKRRRPRKKQNEDCNGPTDRICSFSYVVRVMKNDKFTEIPVCVKFFFWLFMALVVVNYNIYRNPCSLLVMHLRTNEEELTIKNFQMK